MKISKLQIPVNLSEALISNNIQTVDDFLASTFHLMPNFCDVLLAIPHRYNFDRIPIFVGTAFEALEPGIYYQFDCYDGFEKSVIKALLKTQVKLRLNESVNESMVPAGLVRGQVNGEHLSHTLKEIDTDIMDALSLRGINPINVKDSGIYIWGQQFIHIDLKRYPIVDQSTRHETKGFMEFALAFEAVEWTHHLYSNTRAADELETAIQNLDGSIKALKSLIAEQRDNGTPMPIYSEWTNDEVVSYIMNTVS